ncbi:VOC family protein [Myceligenerans crystallogenes]|uniref:VOC family protein n=1 Tax=Myceligenerans crystallogenes TaxID=316335 RepID=A0ABN2NF08_9MICO
MPATPALPEGAPIWIDLNTPDVPAAVSFYGELFGWEHTEGSAEFGGYGTFTKNGAAIAGSMPLQSPEQPAMWGVYLKTSDVDAALARATAAGATALFPVHPVGDLGRFTFVIDPAGAGVGFWEAARHTGTELVMEAGAPAWYELMAKDYDASVAFYTEAALWDAHVMMDTPEMRYTTLGKDRDAVAGIYDAAATLPAEAPGTWRVYFGSDDVDASFERVKTLGGAVAEEPRDSPYGRWGTAVDPAGVPFNIIGVND